MPDPITSILGLLQDLGGLAEKLKSIDAKSKLADVHEKIVDLRIEMAGLKLENQRLAGELRQMKDAQGQTEERDGVLWYVTPPPGRVKGPYCPTCMARGTHSVLAEMMPGMDAFGKYECSTCHGHFRGNL